MSSKNQNYVIKINTALNNKPFFVKITDPCMTISRIFSEAIFTLRNTGRPLESDQLDQLFQHHQIFNSGKTVQKGELFKDLSATSQSINEQNVTMVELDLVSSHSGGYYQ
jgi:hypothetical protein